MSYHLFIATIEKVIFDGQVKYFSAPGAEGYFGILANHAPFISSLKEGKIEVTDANGQKFSWKLSGGFFKVKNNEAVLLADDIQSDSLSR